VSEPLIRANDLRKEYPMTAESVAALRGVSLEVLQGDFVAIMGPSGSGKTTLLDALGCLAGITSGSLEVFGQDVSRAAETELLRVRRRGMGFVFQDFLLVPSLTALENLELPLFFRGEKKSRAELAGILELVGLGRRLGHLPKQLSGGEKQRVAIARALAVDPKILIADEPTGNLDSQGSLKVFELLRKLNAEKGLTIITATHDPAMGDLARRIIRLVDGRIQ